MPSKTARAKATTAKKALKEAIEDVARSARATAKKHGATRSVTILKGQTVSKDKPTRVRILKKN